MIRHTFCISAISLVLSCSAWADDDAASGQASGKRQHKPLVITKEVDKASPLAAEEELKPTRVRKPMQDLKNNAQDPTPAMNKSELIDAVAEQPMDAGEHSQRGPGRDARKAARERAAEIAAGKKGDDVAEKTNKSESARAKKKN